MLDSSGFSHEATAQVAAQVGDLLPGEDPGPMFEAITSLWQTIQHMETDVRRVRGQLEQATSKLSSLNRDLKPEEHLAADNADKRWTHRDHPLLSSAHMPYSRYCPVDTVSIYF